MPDPQTTKDKFSGDPVGRLINMHNTMMKNKMRNTEATKRKCPTGRELRLVNAAWDVVRATHKLEGAFNNVIQTKLYELTEALDAYRV